jgi:hypothetical protein
LGYEPISEAIRTENRREWSEEENYPFIREEWMLGKHK